MEELVTFSGRTGSLEGRWHAGSNGRAAVICHPHPLYGGDMDNPVVKAVCRAYQQVGCSTLRFNFRGVGASAGDFGNGVGERHDLLGAMAYVSHSGFRSLDVAGYSFGAWVAAATDTTAFPDTGILLVSPPVAFMEFGQSPPVGRLERVICGQNDELAPADGIRSLLAAWRLSPQLELIPEADHFYTGRLDALEAAVRRHLAP